MQEDFPTAWQSISSGHLRAKQPEPGRFDFGSAALDFLFMMGMPSEFQDLNFDYLKKEKLETVNEVWNMENPGFDNYITLGFNGSGDPIALRQDTQALVYLNHDNAFEEVFINTDLKLFALFVIRIRSFENQLTKLNPDSFFETEFTDEEYDELLASLKSIDPVAFTNTNNHWDRVLDNFKCFREEERHESGD